MVQQSKFKRLYFYKSLLTAALTTLLTWSFAAGGMTAIDFRSHLTVQVADTSIVPIKTQPGNKDTNRIPLADSFRSKTDTFHFKTSKDSLDAPVKYEASDSAVVLIRQKKILLYGKTKTEYKDITLTAPMVELDQQTQVVTAVNRKDSSGAVVDMAHFKSGDNEFSSDTIRFNFKSQIGLTKNTVTQQGEIYVHGTVVKKVNENTTFIKEAKFTTCNLDDPHFAFVTPKMKVINQKLAVSGPAHPEFEGVPIPIYIPFGFYPLSQGRHSGMLPPQFSSNEQYGLGLEGLGYYKVLSDYWDAKIYGNVYSYGGWSVNLSPTYRRRYRYSGSFNLSIQSTKLNFKGDPDFVKNNSYFVTWSHSVDSKARPGTSFSANVNAGSTRYNQYVPNSPQMNFQNQLGSSISYAKSWAGKPYNLSISANHNQNNRTHLVNLSLPDVGFTVSTLYPFQNANSAGTPKWYQKLGVGYNGNFRNQVSFYDTAIQFKRLIDTFQWGAQHSFPITLALPPILNGAVIISPGISYQQVWIAQKMRKHWDPVKQKLDTTVTKGIFTDHQVTMSIGLSTAIYGNYQFKHSRIYAIRHVIRPQFSINYKPDLSKSHYYTDTLVRGYLYSFSEFEGALYPGFSKGRTGGIGFGVDNNLEMKWRSRKDTGENAIKKIKLIDGFGFNSGYNFLRDSLKLDPFSLYLRTTLFEKISITASGILSPYQYDSIGLDIDKYAWQGKGFGIGRLTSGSISISTSFKSKPKDPKKDAERKKQVQQQLNDPTLIADQQRLLNYMQQNPSEFVDFNIPWSLNIGYSLSFYSRFDGNIGKFKKDVNSNLNFNGTFNLTSKWNFSANGYYDFDTKKLQTFSMAIAREMHCWQLAINVTPVGLYRFFNFSISPKASVLQDLRINRTRSFTNF